MQYIVECCSHYNMMTRVTRRSAKRTRITTGVAVIVKSIIDVHHLIRQREPDADYSRFWGVSAPIPTHGMLSVVT